MAHLEPSEVFANGTGKLRREPDFYHFAALTIRLHPELKSMYLSPESSLQQIGGVLTALRCLDAARKEETSC